MTPGGRKVAFTAAQRVEVTRTRGQDFKNPAYNSSNENSGESMYLGQKIKFKQIKSKVGGKDGATASVVFKYGEGLDVVGNAIAVGQQYNVVISSGAWFTLLDVATGEQVEKKQGMDNLKQALLDDPTLYAKFDYMVTCVMRGVEPLSVVDEWDKIVETEEEVQDDE